LSPHEARSGLVQQVVADLREDCGIRLRTHRVTLGDAYTLAMAAMIETTVSIGADGEFNDFDVPVHRFRTLGM